MAPRPTTPREDLAFTRIPQYNVRAYNPASNPYGFDEDGHAVNLMPLADDLGVVARYAAEMAATALDSADRIEAAVEAIEAGPVTSVVGKSGVITAADITAALDLPAVRPSFITAPANGSTPSLTGGALAVSVSGFYSDYGKKQKSIRVQIDNNATFDSPEFDQTFVTQATTVSVSNAQIIFQGGVTYNIRTKQVDEDDKVGDWSAATTFVFPVVPSAPTMTAPTDGAINVGQNSQPVTFTATAYSHPGNVPQASRAFQISKDNFATIVTTVTADAGASSATLSPRGVLDANTDFKVRCVDTDTNGGSATGPTTSFKTVAQYNFTKFLAAATFTNSNGSTTPSGVMFGQDVDSFQKLALPSQADGPQSGRAVTFSEDGSLFLLGKQGTTGQLVTFRRSLDTFTYLNVYNFSHQQSTKGLSLVGDRLALLRDSGVTLMLKNASDIFSEQNNVETGGVGYLAAKVSPSANWLVTGIQGNNSGSVYTLHPTTGAVSTTYSFGLSGSVSAVAFLTNETFFIGRTESPYIELRRVQDSTQLAGPSGQIPTAPIANLAVSKDKKFLAATQQGSNLPTLIYAISGNQFTFVAAIPAPATNNRAMSVSWSEDGTYLALGMAFYGIVEVYKRSGNSFTKLPNVVATTDSTGTIYDVALWPKATVPGT